MIHSTVIHDNNLKIGNNTTISPYCIIEGNVILGNNVTIGSHCIIKGNVIIGDNSKLFGNIVIDGDVTVGMNNRIYYFTTIGSLPQEAKFENEKSIVKIGNNNIIHENVTINGGTNKGNSFKKITNETIVGDNCDLYIASHVGHDTIIGNNVTLVNNVAVGGHCLIEDFVIVGGNSAIHQSIKIGKGAFIGGMCGIASNVLPYSMIACIEGRVSGINIIGMRRKKFDKKMITELSQLFNYLSKESRNITIIELIKNLYYDNKININYQNLMQNGIIKELFDFVTHDINQHGFSKFD